jgi:hypothetical protein
VQGGGGVTFMATDDKPVKVPARANRTGQNSDPVLKIEPLEGTKRLLTALEPRDKEGVAFFAEHGLSRLERAHALVPSILLEVKPPTGEPCAGNPPARFGGGRGR